MEETGSVGGLSLKLGDELLKVYTKLLKSHLPGGIYLLLIS